jgi:hypothetical protein
MRLAHPRRRIFWEVDMRLSFRVSVIKRKDRTTERQSFPCGRADGQNVPCIMLEALVM